MSNRIRTQVFNLGFAVGKLEEADGSEDVAGEPMLTIMTPAYDVQPASSTVVSGWDNLSALAMILLEFTAPYRDTLDPVRGREELNGEDD